MRQCLRKILILISCLVLSVFAIYTQGAIGQSSNSVMELREGFKGVKWGATAIEFTKIRPDITFGRGERYTEKFLGYDAEIVYAFRDNGKWFRIVVYVDEPTKDSLARDFARQFGRTPDNKLRWFMKDLWIIFVVGKDAPILVDGLVDGYVGPNHRSYRERFDQ